MISPKIRQDTDYKVTVEQIGRLERALLSLRRSWNGSPNVLDIVSRIHYQEIVRLRSELDAAMGFAEETYDLALSLQGPDVGLGTAPSSVVASTINNFRVAVQTVTSYLTTGISPGSGRVPDNISKLADFQFMGAASGSVRIMLNLPTLQSPFPQHDQEPVERSVRLILDTVEWISSSDNVGKFESNIGDEHLARLLLIQTRKVIPPRNGLVQRIEFSGRLVPPSTDYILSQSSSIRVRDALKIFSTRTSWVIEAGKLRSADVDSGIFQLRQRPDGKPDLRCDIPDALLSHAIHYLVRDATVVLEGVQVLDGRGNPSRLMVEDIGELRKRRSDEILQAN